MTCPGLASRIGAAQDGDERMLKWSEGLESSFISWKSSGLHTFELTFPDVWNRKKNKAIPWNDVYSTANDQFRPRWLARELW